MRKGRRTFLGGIFGTGAVGGGNPYGRLSDYGPRQVDIRRGEVTQSAVDAYRVCPACGSEDFTDRRTEGGQGPEPA